MKTLAAMAFSTIARETRFRARHGLLALGPDVKQNTLVQRPIESIDLAPTVAAMLGGDARYARGRRISELVG